MAREIRKIGVIGAGQMGSGIAHVCALAGYDVVVHDVSEDRLKSSLATIHGNMARQVSSGKVAEADRNAALKRIVTRSDIDGLADCDLVVEAATENEAVKREVFTALAPILKTGRDSCHQYLVALDHPACFGTDRPERFIGIHFMNPVPVMELVEVIRGIATDAETFETAKDWCRDSARPSSSPRISPASSSTASSCR